MANNNCDKYIKVCEDLGWNVHKYDSGTNKEKRIEIENWSPIGENLLLDFSEKNFVNELKEYAENFDPDEHVAELVEFRGTHGVPKSIRDLINDADAIDEMLQKLSEAVEEAKVNSKSKKTVEKD